jgi:hypothetical protein
MKLSYPFFLLLSFIFVFSSCYTAKQYPYELSENNKAIIKQVFIGGTISCAPGGIYCWKIKNERTDNNDYYINGTRYLAIEITLKATNIKKKTPSFITYIKITNVKVRLFKVEKLFLEELGNDLFTANKMDIEKRLELILKKESETNKIHN